MVELDLAMLFSRVCFHYSMSYSEVMKLPMKTFWMLNKNIVRLLAEQDIRALQVANAGQGGEASKNLYDQLVKEFDNPYKMDAVAQLYSEERDEEGFAALKNMGRG